MNQFKLLRSLSVTVLVAISAIALADDLTDDAITDAQLAYLKKEGLPIPGEGVVLVDYSQLHLPGSAKIKYKEDREQIKTNGFVNEYSERAKELLSFIKTAAIQFKQQTAIQKPIDTTLRKSSKDIAFAYSYLGVPMESITKYIGIAPAGVFTKEKGWTGSSSFFNTNFGTCSYTEFNVKLMKSASHIDRDSVNYSINDKITLNDARGTDSTGYLYQVLWYDLNFHHKLECATKKYSESTMNKVIELAKTIDNRYN